MLLKRYKVSVLLLTTSIPSAILMYSHSGALPHYLYIITSNIALHLVTLP